MVGRWDRNRSGLDRRCCIGSTHRGVGAVCRVGRRAPARCASGHGIDKSLLGQDRARMDAGHLRILLCVGDPAWGVGGSDGHRSFHHQSRAGRMEKTVWLESWKSLGLVLRRRISPPLRSPLRRRLHLRAHDQWDISIGHQFLCLFVRHSSSAGLSRRAYSIGTEGQRC